MQSIQKYIEQQLAETVRIANEISRENIEKAIDILFSAWKEGRGVFLMGNGGSASTATHFAADLARQGVSPDGTRRLRALPLADIVPLVSAITNDDGWDKLYVEQLKTYARPGDVGIGISVHGGSGKDKAGAWSQNLLKGLQYLKDNGGPTIGLIGFDGGPMKDLVDVSIIVPANSTPLVEGFHVVLHHLIAARLREQIAEAV